MFDLYRTLVVIFCLIGFMFAGAYFFTAGWMVFNWNFTLLNLGLFFLGGLMVSAGIVKILEGPYEAID